MTGTNIAAGRAWLALVFAFGTHVADEAATHFLDFYNPYAEFLRARTGLPVPMFTFNVWLSGLVVALLVLLLLSPLVFAGKRWIRPLQYLFAVVMLANGAVHLVASIYLGRLAPGTISSPLLLIAGSALLYSTARQGQARATATHA